MRALQSINEKCPPPVAAGSGRVENHLKRIGVVYPFMVTRRKGKVKMKCKRCEKEIPGNAVFCQYCGRKQITERRRKRRAAGSGCIYKLDGKRKKPYVARSGSVYLGTFPTVDDADRALAAIRCKDITDTYNMTFAQVYEAWRPTHESELISKSIERAGDEKHTSGMGGYAAAFKHCAVLHNTRFRSLRIDEMQAVIDKLRDSGKSKSTLEKVRQLYGQLFKWAITEGIVSNNKAARVVIIAEAPKEKEVFTAEEIERMQHSDIPAAGITLLLLATGGRITELFSVRTEDCHDDYFIGGVKSSAGTNRVIPVTQIGLGVYKSLLDKARREYMPRLIDAYSGQHNAANWRKREYYPMLEALGIPKKTPHCTRHTYITNAIRSGVKPEDLMRMVGHASYNTTIKCYDHPDAGDLVEAARKIEVGTSGTA